MKPRIYRRHPLSRHLGEQELQEGGGGGGSVVVSNAKMISM